MSSDLWVHFLVATNGTFLNYYYYSSKPALFPNPHYFQNRTISKPTLRDSTDPKLRALHYESMIFNWQSLCENSRAHMEVRCKSVHFVPSSFVLFVKICFLAMFTVSYFVKWRQSNRSCPWRIFFRCLRSRALQSQTMERGFRFLWSFPCAEFVVGNLFLRLSLH